ncbi:hypothetical protein HHK36_027202 [Tetracentron sinense]|uniref:Reverse transcriptase/retrotransposon-derived protein RNase H-like domain-containing protein n=1 Tax=Tetracentron sinense TaxID=13715 RepID=A0A834YGY9_TETSI|nr:hypothetical protein HHK36_027202 [Tetracentron sinense]
MVTMKEVKDHVDHQDVRLEQLTTSVQEIKETLHTLLSHFDDLALECQHHPGHASVVLPGVMTHGRTLRIEFPKFDGMDPQGWLFRIDINKSTNSSRALCVRFGSRQYVDPGGSLSKLKQTSIVRDFQTKFERLVNLVPGLLESHLVSMFTSGLRDDIRAGMRTLRPSGLTEGFELAVAKEEELAELHAYSARRFSNRATVPRPSLPSPTSGNTSSNLSSSPASKRLTWAEQQERRSRGLCFHCDDLYKLGQRCQRPQALLMEAAESSLEEEPDPLVEDVSKSHCMPLQERQGILFQLSCQPVSSGNTSVPPAIAVVLCQISTIFGEPTAPLFICQRIQVFLFGQDSIAYLGHVISAHGVAVDTDKICTMLDWPTPSTLKALRGFLGLASYYHKFVRDYGKLSAPLTQLLKKDSFVWGDEPDKAFSLLKKAMTSTPVLALPDISKVFYIECDVPGGGVGAVLMQEGRPLAYLSKALSGKNLHLSIYDKEMLAILFAVQKWRPYLLVRHFKIYTDHRSTDNTAADALSRLHEAYSLHAISSPIFSGLDSII